MIIYVDRSRIAYNSAFRSAVQWVIETESVYSVLVSFLNDIETNSHRWACTMRMQSINAIDLLACTFFFGWIKWKCDDVTYFLCALSHYKPKHGNYTDAVSAWAIFLINFKIIHIPQSSSSEMMRCAAALLTIGHEILRWRHFIGPSMQYTSSASYSNQSFTHNQVQDLECSAMLPFHRDSFTFVFTIPFMYGQIKNFTAPNMAHSFIFDWFGLWIDL